MPVELTPEGERAYRLLAWVNESPRVRAAEAVSDLNGMALALRGNPAKRQALREVRDVGVVVSRMAEAFAISQDFDSDDDSSGV